MGLSPTAASQALATIPTKPRQVRGFLAVEAHVDQDLLHPYLLHPRTGEPLRAVGIVAGRPVWPIMGGDGSEGDANDGGTGDGGEGGTGDGGEGAGEGEGEGGEDSRANRQAARYRTQLRDEQQRTAELEQQLQQTNDVLNRLRAAITGEDGDGNQDGDPAAQVTELTGRVETLATENTQLRAALLVHDLAPEVQANASALLDSRSFAQELDGLDPSAEDYRTQVTEAMRTAVSKNAAYRAGQGSSRGGSELHGDREQQTTRPKGGLRGAIGGHYGS